MSVLARYAAFKFPVNFQLVMICVFGLAAPQHKRYCDGRFGSMFLSLDGPAGPAPKNTEENQMFTQIVRFLRSWKRYNRSLNELNRLGDRELADIGISRSDIPRVAWGAAQRA